MNKVKQGTQWGLLICLCSYNASFAQVDLNFESKVALMQTVDPENLRCFAERKHDLTCFWEEKGGGSPDQYKFTYKYENEESSECNVTSHAAEGKKTRYFCHLPKVLHFGSLDLHVFRGDLLLYNRSLFVNLVFLLDPPANLTVTQTGKQGQLRLSWLPPPLKYMDNSMMYEVSCTSAGNHLEKVIRASTEFTLRGLTPNTRYDVQVRVKPDGLTYDGYWSAWSAPVSTTTPPNDVDPLVLSLCLIIFFILTLLFLTALMSHRRFLLKKMWPLIPSPENKFQGLFTDYGGDFREWLGHRSGGLRRTPAFFSSEEFSAMVEVLSEANLRPESTHTVESMAACLTEAVREENKTATDKAEPDLMQGWKQNPHGNWLINQLEALQQDPFPAWSLPLESKDAYVTLDQSSQPSPKEAQLDGISEESSSLQVLFATTDKSISDSDLGSLPQSAGSGRLSSESSFDYPQSTWTPKGFHYTSLTVADSGVSVDYSPMSSSRTGVGALNIYSNNYKNEIQVQREPSYALPFSSGC